MLQFTEEILDHGGALRASLDDQAVGEILFTRVSPGVIDIHHTGVDPAFEGRGYGKQLVAAAVDLARRQGWKVKASCPYADKVLARTGDYQDVRFAAAAP